MNNETEMKNHVLKVHQAQQEEKLQSHQVHELIYTKEKGYVAVPIPQYPRQ